MYYPAGRKREGESYDECHSRELVQQQTELARKVNRFLRNVEIHDKVRSLKIFNGLTAIGDEQGHDIHPDIMRGIEQAFALCANLTELSIGFIDISEALLHTATTMPNLQRLLFWQVHVTDANILLRIQRGSYPPSTARLLQLRNSYFCDLSWHIVSLFPSTKWLAVANNSTDSSVFLPPRELRPHLNPFALVERLSLYPLDNSDSEEFIDFSRWMRLEMQHRPPPLKHAAIVTRSYMTNAERDALITAIPGNQLRTLVLGDIQHVEPRFISHLAELFPVLEGLTLWYRPSNYHDRSCQWIWPYPSYEYAPHLAAFSKLRHFGWNSQYGEGVTPFGLEMYERFIMKGKSLNDAEWDDEDYRDFFMADTDVFEDDEEQAVVRLFATYCPVLSSVSYYFDRSFPWFIMKISRDGGRITVTTLKNGSRELCSPYMPAWFGTLD
jgi:hypothetical protein